MKYCNRDPIDAFEVVDYSEFALTLAVEFQ